MRRVEPGLTAVAQPTYGIGRRAARLLLRRTVGREGALAVGAAGEAAGEAGGEAAKGGSRGGRVRETLEPSLVLRESAAPPPEVARG